MGIRIKDATFSRCKMGGSRNEILKVGVKADSLRDSLKFHHHGLRVLSWNTHLTIWISSHLKTSSCQIFIRLKRHAHYNFGHMRIHHLTLLHISRCSCYLTPITYLSERKIEIFAVPTDPISNPLSERFLNLLLENHHLLLHYFILIGVLHVLILFVAAHTIRADSLK